MGRKDSRDLIRKSVRYLGLAKSDLNGCSDALDRDAEEIIGRVVEVLEDLNDDLKPDDQVSLDDVEGIQEEFS